MSRKISTLWNTIIIIGLCYDPPLNQQQSLCYLGSRLPYWKETLIRDNFNLLDCNGTPSCFFVFYIISLFQLSLTVLTTYLLIIQTLKSVTALALCLSMKEAFSWQNVWCSFNLFGPLLVDEGGSSVFKNPLLIDEGDFSVFKNPLLIYEGGF